MSAMRLAATAVKIAPQCNIRHTACGALAVSGRVEVKKSCAVGDVSSTSTVSQCRADDVAAAAAPSSVPDRDGTSPGIFGQTASPPPVPASGQKAGPSLEALARSAVAALIEETSKPADGQDAARLEALRKEAVCAARAYLEQVNPSDRKSLAYASRLVGEAHGTTQLGLARRADHVALNKYSILFKMTKSLESRLKDPASNPLTGHERQAVDRAIEETRSAAERNVVAWKSANANLGSSPESYGDARICTSGLASAEETRDLVLANVKEAQRFVRVLDQLALHREIDSL